MGIVTEKTDTQEDVMIKDEVGSVQNGKYYMGSYGIHWSLNMSSNTITLNIANRPDLGIKVISNENPHAEFHVDEPWYKRLNAKISADFNSRQLSLDGNVIILTGSPRPSERWFTRRYENVIIVSW